VVLRSKAFLLALTWAASAAQAQPQTPAVRLLAPRPFGYFLGDVIHHEAEIVVEPEFRLDPASVPKPGPRTYWLDLRAVETEEQAGAKTRRYRLKLEYQTFYAALETRRLQIPAFAVSFTGGADRIRAEIPAWPFLASPMREIIPAKGEGWSYLRPDAHPQPFSSAFEQRAFVAATLSAILALAALAWGRAWPPFHERRGRPFAQAMRRVKKAAKLHPVEDAHREALLALHRAFDAAAGRRLLADDIGLFLQSRPAYLHLEPGVARFFAASRQFFFAGQAAQAMALMPIEELARLGGRLRAAERWAR
jgi:mxaA protein